MSTHYKPCSLAYDLETTRPGEQVHAEPEPLRDEFARRLRDVERAGVLRLRLCAAENDAWECARLCRRTLRDFPAAYRHLQAAHYYHTLYRKVCRLQARARGEASDG
jgi:hypothetical protein